MKPSEMRVFQGLLAALAAYFPNSRPNIDAIADGYFEDLSTLSLEQVVSVFKQARRECQFFPTIAEFRGPVKQLSLDNLLKSEFSNSQKIFFILHARSK